jgi:hypothetical protein
MGKPWVAYSWLFEVLVSKIYGRWGLHGMLALTDLLMLACMAGIIALLSRYISLVRAAGLGAVVLAAILPLVSPRPWLLTVLFFVIELYLLLEARERGDARWLWPVVPLFALWANVHIQFVYGLGLIGLFALEQPLGALAKWDTPAARLRARCFWILLGVSALATLANPYGWRLYGVVVQYASQTAPLEMVQEMRAMDFRGISDWAALVLVCSAFFAQAASAKKNVLLLALLIVSCWFGFRASRDVWFLAIASAVSLASSIGASSIGTSSTGGGEQDQASAGHWKPLTIALPVSIALMFAVFSSEHVSEKRLQQGAERRFPVKAAAYVESHALRNPLYNPYGWGGYLIWRLPGMPVSIDGRANLQGDAHLTRSVATHSGKRDWAQDRELEEANTILLERDCALASILRSDARYRVVYEDDVASVFEPVRVRTGVSR